MSDFTPNFVSIGLHLSRKFRQTSNSIHFVKEQIGLNLEFYNGLVSA
jgi:hypothetical protein